MYDADHPVTQTLIYIHSMETFIYKDLKNASLQKDITKVLTLGPYFIAINEIIGIGFYNLLVKNE